MIPAASRAALCGFAVILGLSAMPARSDGIPGEFDYYVLALSWNASWCDRTGDTREAQQCAPGIGPDGFVLHGLWPQYRWEVDGRRWPEFCEALTRPPTAAETESMADLMGSAGLAEYQWRKHGSCTGHTPADYFAAMRRAWEDISRPGILDRISEPLMISPAVIEDAFVEVNPGLDPSEVAVICRDGQFTEARICLDRSLNPIDCDAAGVRECRARTVEILPAR